jgi:hypothetical protein
MFVTATRRHNFSGKRVLTLSKRGGHVSMKEDKALIKQQLDPQEYGELREKVLELFKQIEKSHEN